MTEYPTHKTVKTKPYSVWDGIRTRCNNPKACNYANYGGKGVTICAEWDNDFQAFAIWYLQECESLGIDPETNNYQVDKDELCNALGIAPAIYSPTTCKLVSHTHNAMLRNKPTNPKHELIDSAGNEITVTNLRVFCDTHGLSYAAMRNVTSGRTKQHKGYSLKI